MTDPLDQAPESDDRPPARACTNAAAPTPVAGAPARTPWRPRPSAWARAFRWWLGLSVVACLGVALCVAVGVLHFDLAPMHLVIEGDELPDDITISGLSDGGRALLAVGAGLLALLVVLLVPLLVLLVLLSVAIAVICGVGVPLIVLAVVLAAVTSPIWTVGLLVWMAARRRDMNHPRASATMRA